MFEFKKLCEAYEKLDTVEKGLLLAEKSVKIMAKLHCIQIPGLAPEEALAGFIIGSVTSDGKIDEQEYLLIYPSLVRAFGYDFDFAVIKNKLRIDTDCRKALTEYTKQMLRILTVLDDGMKNDIITLCLCVASIDGKISLKEKNYIKQLCEA